jgi:protein-S-isoprenylcysteine O-methyltransferase Ste14
MSNSTTPKRLLRWALVCSAIAVLLFAVSGRWLDPWLWAYVAVFAAAGLYPALKLDDDLARERFRPPDQGADRVPLGAIRVVALAHVIVGALDSGRWHLTQVPPAMRFVGLVGMALALALTFRAMIVNRFFSAVIRIQRDRGHLVVDTGPYSIVRHPGYVGMIAAIPFGALAIGSWLGVAVGLAYSALMVRRVVFEDGFLHANLEGYTRYAGRVRYRLIPGVW